MTDRIEALVTELVSEVVTKVTKELTICGKYPCDMENAGKKWTECDKYLLGKFWKDTYGNIPIIARRLGRSPHAIHCQIYNALKEVK